MGILDRVSRLVRANVNDLLDSAEDPEKMLDQILRDMQSSIVDARSQVAAMIAQEKELEADAAQTGHLAEEWGAKAERAVNAGKDDLAKVALTRQRDYQQHSATYEQQLAVQRQTVEQLKGQLRQLEAKYETASGQRDALIARQRRAHAQRQVAEQVVVFSPSDPSAELDRMEKKIRTDEARTAAALEMHDGSLEAQFRELDNDDADIDIALADLKQRLGKGDDAKSLPAGDGKQA